MADLVKRTHYSGTMKLEAGTVPPERPKPEKEAQPEVESRVQEVEPTPLSPVEAEAQPPTPPLPQSGSEAQEAEWEPLDFVEATEQDFEEVLAISGGIYGGLDYLPSRYHSWLQEPQRIVVLAKLRGAVVALESVCVVDEGETALMEGLRVAPWERGKGVAGQLQRFCSGLARQRHPGLRVLRLIREVSLGPQELQKYRLVATQAILRVRFNASQLLAGLAARLAQLQASGTFSPLPTEDVSEAAGDVAHLLLMPSVQRDVLPGGSIIQDWQPYRPSESNLQLLAAHGLEWRVDSRACPRVLSVSSQPFLVPLGGDNSWCCLCVDAFGCDAGQVCSQLLWHLQRRVPRLAGLNVVCQLFLAPSLWAPLADFCQAGLGFELVKGYTEQHLLETDI